MVVRVEQQTPNMEGVPPGVPAGSKRIKSELLQELQRFDEVERSFLAENVWVSPDGGIYVDTRTGLASRCNQFPQVGGYMAVTFTPGQRKRLLRVNRLVLWAFHGEQLMELVREMQDRADRAANTELRDLEAERYRIADNWQAGHLDGNPTNNREDNIAPQTIAENSRQSWANPNRASSAPALSRPVHIISVPDDYEQFRVGHVFASESEAARQTGFPLCGISRSVHGGLCHGVRFGFSERADDADEPGESWTEEVWFEGVPLRVSSHGRIKHRGIKTHGTDVPGTPYRRIGVGGKLYFAHVVILRCWLAVRDPASGKLVAAAIPRGQFVLHGGASADERRVGGYERNWPVDLRVGTLKDNASDREHERERRSKSDK